jgi:hypothetical protein
VKQKIKPIIFIIFIFSALALVWINTGSRTESGYTYCGGGGFIPQSSLIPDNPGGPCLGQPTTGKVSGRYSNSTTSNEVFSLLGIISLMALVTLQLKKAHKKS